MKRRAGSLGLVFLSVVWCDASYQGEDQWEFQER